MYIKFKMGFFNFGKAEEKKETQDKNTSTEDTESTEDDDDETFTCEICDKEHDTPEECENCCNFKCKECGEFYQTQDEANECCDTDNDEDQEDDDDDTRTKFKCQSCDKLHDTLQGIVDCCYDNGYETSKNFYTFSSDISCLNCNESVCDLEFKKGTTLIDSLKDIVCPSCKCNILANNKVITLDDYIKIRKELFGDN
jgi:hypothetical protein